jgi:intracellular multiplication protein IcmL
MSGAGKEATPSKSAPKAGPAPAAVRRPASGAELLDEKTAIARFTRLRKLVIVQTWAIAVLCGLLLVTLVITQPIYYYIAQNPETERLQMVGLDVPNMTTRAVLSWSTTSITEIMTMGFGDMDTRLPQQRHSFTKAGWKAFRKAFALQKVGEVFKQSQLVLTTVPSNTPVIVWQGINEDDVYQWVVEMPVIMTYATNNNVMRREKALAVLLIVRVPTEDSSAGIAIENWQLLN